MSAKLEISDDVMGERFDRMMDAFESKDFAKAKEIAGGIPLPPVAAMQRKSYMSKNAILALGFDMSHVVAEYGEDWYEKP